MALLEVPSQIAPSPVAARDMMRLSSVAKATLLLPDFRSIENSAPSGPVPAYRAVPLTSRASAHTVSASFRDASLLALPPRIFHTSPPGIVPAYTVPSLATASDVMARAPLIEASFVLLPPFTE